LIVAAQRRSEAKLEFLVPNRFLTPEELDHANALLADIRTRIDTLSAGDRELKFAYRRKIGKELGYDERSKPMIKRALKMKKRKAQDGKCAICTELLPEKYAVLDRLKAVDGYTFENTRLICELCDRKVQQDRRFA
jgi:UTP:GlnB (protein PII) uridylyltransferase